MPKPSGVPPVFFCVARIAAKLQKSYFESRAIFHEL